MVVGRLLGGEIIFLAIDEPDHVGVLLDRARFPQVRELRPLVLALLDLAAELGESDDRNAELLGERLEAAADLRDLVDAVVVAAPPRALEELEIVDDDEADAALPLEPAGAGAERRDGEARRVVDIERQAFELGRGPGEVAEILLADLAHAQILGADPGLLGEDSGGELVGRHLQAEEGDPGAGRLAPARSRPRPCRG